MVLSLPHGGKLINQIVRDPTEKARLVKEAQSMVKITIDSANLNDIQCIGIGAFSPLNGFMKEEDYLDVVTNMSDYKTGNSASLYDYNNRDSYECYECGQKLRDSETYEAYGKFYCRTCYQGK